MPTCELAHSESYVVQNCRRLIEITRNAFCESIVPWPSSLSILPFSKKDQMLISNIPDS